MEVKDYFTIGFSTIALLISIISNFVQKSKETDRNIRKNLSETLEDIIKINLEFAKLKQDSTSYNSENVIELRRIYNSQKRILSVHADFLSLNYYYLFTDIDCNILAGAFTSFGDYLKADEYWKKTIEKSVSASMRHMNLRGYARFLYSQGKREVGRSKYAEALQIEMADTDDNRRIRTDTYIMWAKTERDNNNPKESERLLEEAKSSASRIGQSRMRKEIEEQILLASPSQEQ